MTERFRVLFITEWYPTKESPVGCNYIREHAKAVSRFDDVILFHMAGYDPELDRLWAIQRETDETMRGGIETFRVWYRRSPIPKISYFISLWSVMQAFRWIVAQGFRPDIIHAHVYEAAVPAVIIGKFYRIPVVVTEHSSEFPRRLLSRYKIWKARVSFRLAQLVMPVSRFLKRSIENHGIKARFEVVPNVVDTELFHVRSHSNRKRSTKRLLVVSLLDRFQNKGLLHLLKGLAELRHRREDWHLYIVGDGPARPGYEGIVRELGLSDMVTFHGLKTKREVSEYMRQSDLFVLPSLMETFSIVCAEALATGIPVVASRCGGPQEFLTRKTGRTVPPGDARALCEGLDYMLDHLKTFSPQEMSEYSSSRFGPEHIGKRLHSVYSKVIARAGE